MWPPPTTLKDLDAGTVPYGRTLPRRSRPRRAPAAAPVYHPSPLRPSSAVPFSWEHRPGIPKSSAVGPISSRSTIASVLPLPPPLRSAPTGVASHKIKPSAFRDDDPFAAALAECAKAPPGPDIDQLFVRRGSAAGGRGRRPSAASWSVSDRMGLFGLLHASSCKATCAVADSTVLVPRPASRTAS